MIIQNGNDKISRPQVRRTQTLREQFSQPTCWEATQPPESIIRFCVDSGEIWGLPAFGVIGCCYHPDKEMMSIGYGMGTIIIKGPTTLKFYEDFCRGKATMLRADGKDILSVSFVLSTATPSRDGGDE